MSQTGVSADGRVRVPIRACTDRGRSETRMDKSEVVNQGKVVIEADGEGWLVMTPDGAVVWRPTRKAAEDVAKRWFKKYCGLSTIGVGNIEWRP